MLVDGTFWTDDEMIRLGVSRKRARDIGHLPQSGAGGMIEWLDTLPSGTRKILIHINNTNPILDEASAERAELRAAGSKSHATAWRSSCEQAAWTAAEFEQQLRTRGSAYHIHHPFNVMFNTGRASPEQIRGWVANRFYYQINIPIKDAAILANCPDRDVRRSWVQRILDHDGYGDDPGRHRVLASPGEAVGLRAGGCGESHRGVAGRAVRRRRVREFRAPRAVAGGCVLLADRVVRAGDPQTAARQLARPTIRGSIAAGLQYFQSRVSLARRDVEFGLAFTLGYFKTPAQQQRALEILQFKLDVLWQMNDAMALRYGVTS